MIENNKIKQNAKAHNTIAEVYDLKHPEIYNQVEQRRVEQTIETLLNRVAKNKPRILDLGSGTGNLALKFLNKGCWVTACDVSQKSLDILSKRANNNSNLELSLLIDKKLPFENNSFDVVATYSVLHHIPDYLFTIKEFIRVLKPGGYIYIDHEANENKWKPNALLEEYNDLTKQTIFEHLIKLFKTRELFTFNFIRSTLIISFINNRYKREGDIHVWIDDHIEWQRIFKILTENNCSVIEDIDYLMYRPKCQPALYEKYRKSCTDTKYVFIKK
ncbi:Ubiquinone/menaquinone biosynthesis C-methyltransferase UbiE [uncultured archaeon]|nr:Ubiquinone/menaquinone biosynthesis C-methyltransferase UbiE [uncultured archaeon]